MAVFPLRAAGLFSAALMIALPLGAHAQDRNWSAQPDDYDALADDYAEEDYGDRGDYSDGRYDDDPRDEEPREDIAVPDRSDAVPAREAPAGADAAVDACVARVEDDQRRVERIETTDPDRGGWLVSGITSEQRGFDCTVDATGEVEDLSYREDDDYDPGERG